MKKIVVTGAGGLLGWHACTRLHAKNCAADFRREVHPYEIAALDHRTFESDSGLWAALRDADAVLHFAGVNRAVDDVIERTNPAIATRLAQACAKVGVKPHIVYANSTHAANDTPYGRSKKAACEILGKVGGPFTNLILPHIFGECAKPFYNNVTATLVEQIISGMTPTLNAEGKVNLLHAGAAAQAAIDAALKGGTEEVKPPSTSMSVIELYERLDALHRAYTSYIFPQLSDPFTLALFNSYRAALYPQRFPMALKLNEDQRGILFEAAKGGGGGQTFLSWTNAGVRRGDHFHIGKVERFLVLQGEARIRIRKVLRNEVWDYSVSGAKPVVVDMPTLHTHSIENVGSAPLLTLFWAHEIFDPKHPDTYFDPVERA